MADPEAVAKAFTDHYYATFDTARNNLAGLYQDQSMLTFEGQKFQGTQAILQKLTSLPFQQCKHHISSLDAQPSLSGGVLVFVTGQLLPEGETNPLKFSQTFHLAPVGGSYVVTNDLFRLNYG
ncbi:Nuclear transport factor 2 [Micractinium conductrix]|uniref:Nuclear transport factor 2 n=1 Tax=Micractinium conductrix TaxID=554055 RepID=A0A2P6VA10_9CHLO|nr:Nuclear transport factor 2 [Micractinium conductrix]|eukprot:PSC70930.1 Nuclear transport factor 2 [Micractinium conductrix]